MDAPAAEPPAALTELRARLDSIDARLLDELRDRLACCADIARVKTAHGVPMMQPRRIGLVQQRAAAYGAAHGVDADFLRRFYELVIAETCRLESEIMEGRDARCARS